MTDKPTTEEMLAYWDMVKSWCPYGHMEDALTDAIRVRLADYDALRHIMECADTPLMRNVLKERDALKARVAIDAETIRLNFETIDKAIAERDALKAEVERLKKEEHDRTYLPKGYVDEGDFYDKGEEPDWKSRAEKAEADLAAARNRPKIVCFCGSVRFSSEMMVWAWECAKRGLIVLTWHVLPDGYFKGSDDQNSVHGAEVEGVREIVDELHKRKIDLADVVYVVNVGGYIGDSTKSEVAYAIEHGKEIVWLEREHAEANRVAALAYRAAKDAKKGE